MKKLLNNYREYNDGIEILINKFESEFEESEELKTLKKQYKSIVENSIKSNNLDEATSMITEYETMFSKDNDILNMKGIIAMHNGNFKEAELLFKEATLLEVNYNTMFNIAYLKESIGEINEATSFYKKIILLFLLSYEFYHRFPLSLLCYLHILNNLLLRLKLMLHHLFDLFYHCVCSSEFLVCHQLLCHSCLYTFVSALLYNIFFFYSITCYFFSFLL